VDVDLERPLAVGAGRRDFTPAVAGDDTVTFTAPVQAGGNGERLELSFFNASSPRRRTWPRTRRAA
jgi:hypothetical protein